MPSSQTGFPNNATGGGAGVTAFTGLSDTPAGYTDLAGQFLVVNDAETGVEWFDLETLGGVTTLLELSDFPASFGTAGQFLVVNGDTDAVEFADAPEYALLDLSDTPSSFGTAGQVLVVNVAGDGVEFVTQAAGVTDLTDLDDTPGALGTAGQVLAVNGGATALEWTTPAAGVTDFTDLDDTPASFTGNAGRVPRVNSGETALEYFAPPYDMRVFKAGAPYDAEVIETLLIGRAVLFPADFAGSLGAIGTDPTATMTITVKDDATTIGTISISTGGVFTFTTVSNTAKTVAAGSVLTFEAQGTADATGADLNITMLGTL
jgi:hypothetical protein